MNYTPAKTVLGELDERLGIEFVRVHPETSLATMPVPGNRQITGVMHGGAYCTLAETLASHAASEHAGPGRIAMGLDLSATHTRRVSSGRVTATCTALHLGHSVTVHEVVITDEDGNRLSSVRVTNVLRSE